VQGRLDTQVAPHHAERLAELARSRKRGRPESVKVVTVPDVNHLLVTARTGEIAEYQTLSSANVAAELTTAIGDWLKEQLASRR